MKPERIKSSKMKLIQLLVASLLGSPLWAGTPSYRAMVLAENPIVYYEFDEEGGSTVRNSAVTGAAYAASFATAGGAVAVGQASFAQGGMAYDFRGGVVRASSPLASSLEEWTVEAWVNYDPAKTNASNFLSNDQGGWNDDVLIGIGAENGTVGVPSGQVGVIQQGNPGSTRDFAGSPLSAAEWHHVVVTGSTSAGELRLFVDGVLVASDTSLINGVTFNGADGIGTANLTIGAARPHSGDPAYRAYDGLLDEVAIYGTVLDGATIANHHRAGSMTSGTLPIIVALSPVNGTDDAVVSADLVARFSEPMILTGSGSVSLRNLTLGSEEVTVIDLPDPRVSVSGFSFMIAPGRNLALNTHYAVQISADALKDAGGDPFAGILKDDDWNFRTRSELDVTSPRLVSTKPPDGSAIADHQSDLVAVFDEPVAFTGSGSITIRDQTPGTGLDTVIALPDERVTLEDSVLTIALEKDLNEATDYAIRITGDAIVDRSGNPFPGIGNDTTWNFTVPSIAASFGLRVATHASEETGLPLRWPTHLAFGPENREIITDLKNNRFVYRNGADDLWQSSPVSVRGPHSLVHNPVDGLYYANDTENQRIIAFRDLADDTIAAQTSSIAGVTLNRPHDILRDPATGWIYALNPNSGHVFRFTAIGENESAVQAPVGGYARSFSLVDGKIHVIGSARGRIVKIVDWDTPTFEIYDSFDPTGRNGSAGSWTTTGLVLNDAEYFDGAWYASSYFTSSLSGGSDFDENKFIRFETLEDLVAGDWTDLSDLVPSGMTPYYLTAKGGNLYLAIFNHETPGNGDAVLKLTPVPKDAGCYLSDPAYGLEPGEQGLASDPDGDGVPNGLEAWFGTHPGRFDSGLIALSSGDAHRGFSHPRNSSPPDDLTGHYEWSPNLIDWYAGDGIDGPGGGATVMMIPAIDQLTTVEIQSSISMVNLFFRAGVIRK